MGQALQAVSPSLISSMLQCTQRKDIPLSNQKAAIQALRLMDIHDEVKLFQPYESNGATLSTLQLPISPFTHINNEL